MKGWVVAAALILPGAGWAQHDPQPEYPVIGKAAPRVVFASKVGVVETADSRFDTDALILIFATPESADEVMALQSRLARFADAGLPTLIVDVDCFTTRNDAATLWANRGLFLPLGFDDGGLSGLYRVTGVSYAVLIDHEGILRYLGGLGRTAEQHELFTKLAEELISGARLSVHTLPIAEPGYSHLPDCRGIR